MVKSMNQNVKKLTQVYNEYSDIYDGLEAMKESFEMVYEKPKSESDKEYAYERLLEIESQLDVLGDLLDTLEASEISIKHFHLLRDTVKRERGFV